MPTFSMEINFLQDKLKINDADTEIQLKKEILLTDLVAVQDIGVFRLRDGIDFSESIEHGGSLEHTFEGAGDLQTGGMEE